MPINYRRAVTEDLDQIYVLEQAVMPNPWSLESLREAVESPNSIVLVATAEKSKDNYETAGFAIAYLTAFDGELPDIVVSPEYRRQGIGKGLLGCIIKEFESRGLETLFLEVRQSNAAAKGLYGSLGFKEYHTRKNFYTNPVEDGVCMRLDFERL